MRLGSTTTLLNSNGKKKWSVKDEPTLKTTKIIPTAVKAMATVFFLIHME